MKLTFKKKIINKPRPEKLSFRKKPSFGFEKKNFGSPKGIGILAPIEKKPAARFYGDYDGDGVINGLDCEPRNRFKQGPQHEETDQIGWKCGKGSKKANDDISKILKIQNESEEEEESEEESTPGYPKWDKIPAMVEKMNRYRKMKGGTQ